MTAFSLLAAGLLLGGLNEKGTVRVSSFGYDPADATRFVQAALDSGAPRVILDAAPGPWHVLPLVGRSDQALVFEKGARLVAKRGAYHGRNDCLLSWLNATNVSVTGAGEIAMWHDDYTNRSLYAWSEWRHALNFQSCAGVRVEDVRIVGSGGDGLYLGECRPGVPNRDVTVRNVRFIGNNRQGASVISADGLLFERCAFLRTCGTAPEAGIDFEPNAPHQRLRRIVLRDCLAEGNAGRGFDFAKWLMGNRAEPVDITLERCTSLDNRRGAVTVETAPNRHRDVRGRIAFRDCVLMDAKQTPDALRNRTGEPAAFRLEIENCRVRDPDRAEGSFLMSERWNPPTAAAALPVWEASFPSADAEVVDDAPGASVTLKSPFFRYHSRFFVFAASAGSLRYRVQVKRVGSNPLWRRACCVLDRTGRKIADLPSPGFEPTDWTFVAPARGFYEVRVNVVGNAFGFLETTTPIAVAGGGPNYDRVAALSARPGELFFEVPAKAAPFGFVLAGGGDTEMISATLTDPGGVQACSLENVGWMREWHAPGVPKTGLWRIDVRRPTKGCYDDHSVDLLGLEPVFFLTNAKYWKRKVCEK